MVECNAIRLSLIYMVFQTRNGLILSTSQCENAEGWLLWWQLSFHVPTYLFLDVYSPVCEFFVCIYICEFCNVRVWIKEFSPSLSQHNLKEIVKCDMVLPAQGLRQDHHADERGCQEDGWHNWLSRKPDPEKQSSDRWREGARRGEVGDDRGGASSYVRARPQDDDRAGAKFGDWESPSYRREGRPRQDDCHQVRVLQSLLQAARAAKPRDVYVNEDLRITTRDASGAWASENCLNIFRQTCHQRQARKQKWCPYWAGPNKEVEISKQGSVRRPKSRTSKRQIEHAYVCITVYTTPSMNWKQW